MRDVPQKLALLSTAEIPVGRGRRFGSAMGPVLNQLFGGWQTNWQVTSDVTIALRYGVFVPSSSVVSHEQVRQFLYTGVTLAF